jgi:hypothetical protein
MSQREHSRDNLADLISDMETDVCDLIRWASLVQSLGSTDYLSLENLTIVGSAMEDTAKRVKDSWTVAFELSRPLREVAR